MLKYSVVILLILLTAFQTFSKWCMILEYQANKEFIAKNLCINRARPACCCHGKCYLEKKLKADEGSQQMPARSALREEPPSELPSIPDIVPQRSYAVTKTIYASLVTGNIPQSFITDIFHPPGV